MERGCCRFSGFTNPAYPLRVQRQARDQTRQRVRSDVTQMVRLIEGDESSIHVALMMEMSGQLRFLGSMLFRTRHQLVDIRNRHRRCDKRHVNDGLPHQHFVIQVGGVDEGLQQVNRRDADDGGG